jgi:diguanylate cyclase (GGDEF)-like protein
MTQRLSFRAKVALMLAFSLGVSSAFPLIALFQLNSFEPTFRVTVEERINEYVTTSELNNSLIIYDSNLWKFVASGNKSWLTDAEAAKQIITREIKDLYDEFKVSKPLTDSVKSIEQLQQQYFATAEQIVHSKSRTAEKTAQLTSEYNRLLVRVFNATNRLNQLKKKELVQTGRTVRDRYQELLWIAIMMGVIFTPLLIGIALLIYNTTAKPVRQLTDVIKKVSENDFTDMSKMVKDTDTIIQSRKPNDELTVLARAIRNLGQQIEDKTRDLEKLVVTDEKTKLYNFRYFKSELNSEIQRAKRFDSEVSLIMLDVDKFKHYNDTNGHLLGDEVLIKVARIIRDECRETDQPARFGGEEFSVLLPSTNKREAVLFAERVRKAIEDAVFVNQEKQPNGNLTASLGVASFPEDSSDAESLINCADQALYKAKENGRNRVEAFNLKLTTA